MLCTAALAHRMTALGPRKRDGYSFWAPRVARLFEGKPLFAFVGLLLAISVTLLWPGIAEYATTAQITLHWSRLLVGTLAILLAFQAIVTSVLIQVVSLWQFQRAEGDRRRREQALHLPHRPSVRPPLTAWLGEPAGHLHER
jgi:hypothetical protein